ncbi:LOB domain-containing protein 22 [Magnolia sinica]|uniref:LOB domain-containing protein 22 n=1 Tax=Magnolia sinica TaxID=86752 RepID=UPI00265A28A0|nr:LOB domain-containing protein 22 [Magnolia sinica]
MSNRGGVNGSGTQACAACKYQRRKCAPDCILAPYFPPDQQRQFLNAHKLFGVSNIVKVIRNLDPLQKSEAMRSIIFQSDIRARNPVGGCHQIIVDLQKQIEQHTIELELVLRKLAMYREQACTQSQVQEVGHVQHGQLGLDMNLMSMSGYNPMQQYHHLRYHHDVMPHVMPTPSRSCMEGSSSSINAMPLNEFGDMKMQYGIFDRNQNYPSERGDSFHGIDSFTCSNRVALKDEQNSMEQVQEHDLKGAASLFTLTNCNS